MTADENARLDRLSKTINRIAADKNRVTRGDGLHVVPSQLTERHQAGDTPLVWPVRTRLDRLVYWYNSRLWPALVLMALPFVASAIAIYYWSAQ